MPATRSISPDRAAFAAPWPGRLLFWPVGWLVVALVFGGLALRHRGTVDPVKPKGAAPAPAAR